jgi:hypothetical protein
MSTRQEAEEEGKGSSGLRLAGRDEAGAWTAKGRGARRRGEAQDDHGHDSPARENLSQGGLSKAGKKR